MSYADLMSLANTARDTSVPHQGTLIGGDVHVANPTGPPDARRLPDAGPTRTPPRVTTARLTGRGAAGGPQFEDGTPIPRTLLDRLACDSELHRILFGAQSEVLDVGRTERTFTRARRTALIARDHHCQYPTCTAPPALCEGHHIDHWARDHGPTAVHNGILLCWHHHALIHRRHIEIHRRGHHWVFLDPHGTPINPDNDRQAPA